jgi:hypothetical protein
MYCDFTAFRVRRPIPVAAQSKACVCGRSLAGVVGSNSARAHGCLFLVSVVCCHSWRPLRRVDHSFKGFLPAVCLSLSTCVWPRNLYNEAA